MSLTRRYRQADGTVKVYHYDRVGGVPAKQYHREVAALHRSKRCKHSNDGGESKENHSNGDDGDDDDGGEDNAPAMPSPREAFMLPLEDQQRIKRLHQQHRVSQRRLADVWNVSLQSIRQLLRD
jgi:hypothetical protein